ncbi:MAG: Ldh family oxidoreductase [Acidaminococcales bacterium]|nr:Ldh family oxidoreductase [Acidaminococcales bacterium]
METKFDKEKLAVFCQEILQAAGLAPEHAARVAGNLVAAELRGVRSHGLIQVKNYVGGIKSGAINKNPQIKTLKEAPAAVLIDGDAAPGAVSGVYAMDKCIKKAKTTGMAGAAVVNGTHFGMAAYYAMRALEHDMIGFAFCNARPRTAVHGGISRALGTNPICAAIPAEQEPPVVFDAATSKTAYNKILYALREGRGIEKGLALDAHGNDTDDPAAALQGAFFPFGGYKGSGLAVVVQILCSLLTGAACQLDEKTRGLQDDPDKIGFCFMAVDIAAFQPPELFKKSVDLLARRLKNSQKANPQDAIYLPGELEHITCAGQSAHGITLGESVAADLDALRQELSLAGSVADCSVSAG